MIYLDYAATSWPKPLEVIRAMADFLEGAGGNPGRSGHRLSVAAARTVYAAREAVAELFNVPDPQRVIFCLNATHAINLAVRGWVRPGDRVVVSGVEHSALMRPLRALAAQAGVQVVVARCGPDGRLMPESLAAALEEGARLVALTHASNVCGALLPVAEAARLAHARGARLLVDAAQTAGVIPLDMQALGIDMLAFTGHKGLLGPPGTGGLVLGTGVDAAELEPLVRGGTGSRSESESQPEELPDKYESGTSNGVGLAGLAAGVRWVMRRGVEAIRAHELELARHLRTGLAAIPGVTVYGPERVEESVAVIAFRLAGRDVAEVCSRLDEEFGILCRAGLHCAPAAHKTLGTFPDGAVRFAPGVLTIPQEIEAALAAVEKLAGGVTLL